MRPGEYFSRNSTKIVSIICTFRKFKLQYAKLLCLFSNEWVSYCVGRVRKPKVIEKYFSWTFWKIEVTDNHLWKYELLNVKFLVALILSMLMTMNNLMWYGSNFGFYFWSSVKKRSNSKFQMVRHMCCNTQVSSICCYKKQKLPGR